MENDEIYYMDIFRGTVYWENQLATVMYDAIGTHDLWRCKDWYAVVII